MANQLDLEEQEQLDELKHFWNEYGNLISWVLIAVFGAIAAWNGWQYWERTQAAQAALMFDEVDRAAQGGDTAKLERALSDMKDRFGRTAFAQQAALLAAKTFEGQGKPDAAKSALAWVAEHASDEGYQAVARLRLAALLIDAKAYDEALKQLSADFPKDFAALAADRRGDVYNAQGKKAEARAEYTKAYQGLDDRVDYRRIVEVKLTALGVDTRQLQATPGGAQS